MDRPSPHMPPSPAASATAPSARLGVAVLALALVWVAVYWLTPAAQRPEGDVEVAFVEPQGVDLSLPLVASSQTADSNVVGPVEPDQTETQQANPESADPPRVENGIVPPEFKLYVIAKDDNPRSISNKVYGTPDHWRQVMRANPFVDFSRIRVGRTIRVPVDPKNVQGIPADEYAEREKKALEPQFIEYIVENNDTLTGIAKKIYGKASFWTIIRDANLEKTGRDGSKIRPGMVLLIPPPPNKARS